MVKLKTFLWQTINRKVSVVLGFCVHLNPSVKASAEKRRRGRLLEATAICSQQENSRIANSAGCHWVQKNVLPGEWKRWERAIVTEWDRERVRCKPRASHERFGPFFASVQQRFLSLLFSQLNSVCAVLPDQYMLSEWEMQQLLYIHGQYSDVLVHRAFGLA